MAKDLGKKIVAGIQIATLAAAPIVFAASCDGDTKEPEKKPDPCMCDPKEHYDDETCCDGDGCDCVNLGARPKPCMCEEDEHLGIGEPKCGADANLCGCTLQSYGELFAGSGIKIYRVGAVEDFAGGTPIATAVQAAQDGYVALEEKEDFEGKVDEIHIFPATEGAPAQFYRSENGKLIVGIRVNRVSGQIRTQLQGIAMGSTQPTVVNAMAVSRETVRMAKGSVDAAAMARMVVAQLGLKKLVVDKRTGKVLA